LFGGSDRDADQQLEGDSSEDTSEEEEGGEEEEEDGGGGKDVKDKEQI